MIVERGQSTAFRLSDPSGVGEVRRGVAALAQRLAFDEVDRERAAIVATEIASNVVKHGGGGEVVVRALLGAEPPGIELLGVDLGKGIGDVGASMTDGYSTAGTPGNGLGAGRRLSSTFDVHSTPGAGTVVLSRLRDDRSARAGPRSSAVCLPKPGEDVCGDAWGALLDGTRGTLMVADGIGHGPLAADASRAAVDALCAMAGRAPAEILEVAHRALRSTRGAAVAVADVDFGARRVRYAGVGNVAGVIVTADASRQMVSHNGTVGHDSRRIQEFEYPLPLGARVVMHSDGLGSQWRIDRYPGLSIRHPAMVAGVLYRDFTRGRDDVTVAVLAEPGS